MSLIWESNTVKPLTIRGAMEHQKWCFQNDVIIYIQVSPLDWQYIEIVVSDKGKKNILSERFKQYRPGARDANAYDRVWELYTEYYNKYN